ncbi:mucin-5AC [Anopheles darlingi]|uniref:mucin-5AC n=1 Tax=Anopheles darlingi TaxID=43151 RepID=UPI0021000E9E|nr:mucin-5AC [Anopheles darlingi]
MNQRRDFVVPRRLWLVVLLAIATTTSDRARAYNFDDDLEDLIAEESNVDEELQLGPGHAVQLLPSDVFNDGKPFYVERDPSTGAIDFNHKKTVNQLPTDDRGGDGGGLAGLYGSKLPFGASTKESYVSDKKDVIVHHSTPNFHDFLNLPKMYSPENFVSISSSYANLKYQGINNKGSSSNHRDQTLTHIVAATSATTPASTTTHATTTTGAPAASTKHFFNRPQYSPVGRPGGGPTYTYPVTSGRPITTSSTTTTSTTTTTTTTTEAPITTTEGPASSTVNPQKQQLFTRYPYKSTIKNKYLETSEQTRKKFFLPSTLALPGPTTTTTERAPSTPMRSSTYYSPSVRPHWPTTTSTTTSTTTTTTAAPTSTPPANPVRFVDDSIEQQQQQLSGGSKIKFTMPALKYEGSRPAPFRRMPTPHPSQQQHQHTLEQKKRLESQQAAENNRVETVEEDDEAPTTTTTPAPTIVLLDDAAYHRTTPGGPKIEQSIDLSDQYVRYEVHQPPPPFSGASVPMRPPPPPPPPQYGQYPVQQPNGHRPQLPPQVMDGAAGGGQYVRYEVQPPQQMNVVKFGSVPSMNNVVISPNQHSATFVLGSHQSVGSSSSASNSGSVGHVGDGLGGGHFVGSVSQDSMQAGASAAALSAPRPSYQMGQVLDEPNEQAAIVGSASVSVQVKPQDIIKTTSVRFPSESDDQYDNAPIISGTHKSEVLPPNGHSAPVRGPDQMSVVFPPASSSSATLHEVSNRIVFDSPSPPAETLNRNELNIAPNPNYPADLPEQLTPPVQQSTGGPGMQRPPRPPVPSQGPPFRYSEIQRRPTYPSGGGDRVRPTLQLPNILPQFRPNAKISHGHGPYLKEPGTYRVPATGMLVKTGPPALRKPPGSTFRIPAPPTRIMTRLGPSSPSRLPTGGPPVASAELENRRYYRLPPQPPAMIKDRVYNIQPPRLQPPPPPPPASPATSGASSPQPPPQVNGVSEQPNEPLEDNEFHRNPPQILKNILRDELNQQRPKLEPVVTLQMLQSKKQSTANGPNGFQQAAGPAGETGEQPESLPFVGAASSASPQAPPPALRSAHPMATAQSESKDRPVYVVYPVKSTAGGVRPQHAATDALIGQQPPPMIISPGTEYQNTPFSIASHFEQEPILGAKHKNRHGGHAPKPNFPYSLEKPDPFALTQQTLGDHHHQAPAQDLSDGAALTSEYNLGEEPTGGQQQQQQLQAHQDDQDLISSKLQRFHGLQQVNGASGDSTPIAIAYTPTESPSVPDRTGANNMRYNKPANGAGANSYPYYSVYGETQTEVSHLRIDDVDEFGNPSRRYEQSFQAPFQASISLDPVKVTNPYEGWAVVTSSPLQQAMQLQQNPSKPAAAPVATKLVGLEPVAAALGAGELQNTIDRSDTSSTGAEEEERDQEQGAEGHQKASIVTPSSFDPNSFQPELQGGFRPIYGADIKLSEQQNPDPQRSSLADLFAVDDAATQGEQHSAPEQPTTETERPLATKLQLVTKDSKLATVASSAVKKSPEPEEHSEPAMDLDLEAFFDQFTKDYEDEDGGELDDVTMSDETNMTGGSSEQRAAAVGESRSSKVTIDAESSSTEKASASTALVDETTTSAVAGSSTTKATT